MGNDQQQGAISWETDVSLLDNPVILKAVGLWIILTYLVCVAFMSFLAAVQGRWDMMATLALVFAIVCGGLLVLSFVIMAVFYRNRARMRFALDENGFTAAMADRRAKGASLIATGLGAATANPTLAGAGLIAAAGGGSYTGWPAVHTASFNPRRKTILFRNGWRDVGWLVCTPDNYDSVEDRVRAILAQPGRSVTPARRGLLAGHILGTVLILAAAAPVFTMPRPFEVDLFVPLLLLCFALATRWLVPLFGWINLAAIAWLAVLIVTAYGDHGLGRLDGTERLIMAAAIAGLAYLAWFSVRMVMGRTRSALMDLTDEQGGEQGGE